MFVVRIMPMIGEVARGERLNTLSRCHAVTANEMLFRLDGESVGEVLDEAIRQIMQEERITALGSKMSFIVQVEVA